MAHIPTPEKRITETRFQAGHSVLQPMGKISGRVWESVLIAPGISRGRIQYYWDESVLKKAVTDGVFHDLEVHAYSLPSGFYTHLKTPDDTVLEDVKRYLTPNKAGNVINAWYEKGVGVKGHIRFHSLSDIPARLLGGDRLGLSIDARIRGEKMESENRIRIYVLQLVSCSSVDIVTRPAAGGQFIRAVAGKPSQNINALFQTFKKMSQTKEEKLEMNLKQKLIQLVETMAPGLIPDTDFESMTDEQVIGIIEKILSEKGFSDNAQTNTVSQSRQEKFFPAKTENEQKQMETMLKQLEKQFEKRAACDRILKNRLDDSGLPEKAKDRIFNRFLAKSFETSELDRVIQEEKDYLASMSGPVFDLGNQTRSFAKTGSGPVDKLEIALDLAFGLDGQTVQKLNNIKRLDGRPFFHDGRIRAAQDYNGIAPLTGIAELYSLTTGDPEVRGFFNRDNLSGDLRAAQDITSSTFSYILKNTLGRRLVADYISTNYREDILISLKKPVKDFRQQEAVLVGYFDDLSTVDPETADYTEINPVSDEESTYTIAQKGNILTISRKTIINDDISLIKRLVSRLGRAARRTHAQYVWNFFIQNDFCSDGTRWFTVTHGNLGSSALSFSEALTAYKALAKMTEKDSGKPIGLLDDPSRMPLLVYPVDLMETAGSIVNDDFYYSSNDLTTKTRNPLKGKIEGAQISLLTDANDWGLLMPTEAIDMVEMGYLNGRQEPELFLADTPQNEQVFVADKLRYKIRHEYAGAVIDFRSGYKAQVA